MKVINNPTVALEAEDVELGIESQDLALDVDDGVPEEDLEALDSIDEDADGDIEESDCKLEPQIRILTSEHISLSSDARRSTIFSSPE